jgi:hypothetical protein
LPTEGGSNPRTGLTPIAGKQTKGAWYRQWRKVSLDGSTLDVADQEENEKAFGRQPASRGTSAYPQLRFVSLVENGTHAPKGNLQKTTRFYYTFVAALDCPWFRCEVFGESIRVAA